MANSNFKIFAESVGKENVVTDAEYATSTQRINGVVPGLASADLHNKLYKQATIMTCAIAQVLVERGFDAMDNDYEGLVRSLKQAFAFSVNDKKPNNSGNIDYRLLNMDDIYPVGSVYLSVNNVNPATLFGGTWKLIADGRCLIGASKTYPLGSTGGEAEHALLETEMPSHKHDASMSKAGEHKHNRGTMEITGSFAADDSARAGHYGELPRGAFYDAGRVNLDLDSGGGSGTRVGFQASRSWTGETSAAGEHTHTFNVNNAGGGKAHNNMQPYLAVNIWQRTK